MVHCYEMEKKIEELKKALFMEGLYAIEDFCGIEFSGLEEKDTLENEIDNTIAQMPDHILDLYFRKYAI